MSALDIGAAPGGPDGLRLWDRRVRADAPCCNPADACVNGDCALAVS